MYKNNRLLCIDHSSDVSNIREVVRSDESPPPNKKVHKLASLLAKKGAKWAWALMLLTNFVRNSTIRLCNFSTTFSNNANLV